MATYKPRKTCRGNRQVCTCPSLQNSHKITSVTDNTHFPFFFAGNRARSLQGRQYAQGLKRECSKANQGYLSFFLQVFSLVVGVGRLNVTQVWSMSRMGKSLCRLLRKISSLLSEEHEPKRFFSSCILHPLFPML